MAIQKINLGTEPHGVGGDSYRTANDKINKNFEEVSTNITNVDEKYSNTEVKITEEVARAKQVEDELKANLEKEVSRAVSAEADILGVVESESKARTAENIRINEAQTQLKSLVDSEVDKLKLEDTSIKTDLEKTHRYAVMSQTLGLGSKFYGEDGQPLSGGKVYTYEAGTSTLLDTYKDIDFKVSNTNPIILDESGSADVFLKGTYRFRIFDKNEVFVEEQEGVSQIFDSASAKVISDKLDALPFEGGVLADAFVVVDGNQSQRDVNQKTTRTYNNLASMLADDKLKAGQFATTLGYANKGDNGGCDYYIDVASSNPANRFSILLDNPDLRAVAISKDNTLNIAQVGVLPTNTGADNKTKLDFALSKLTNFKFKVTDTCPLDNIILPPNMKLGLYGTGGFTVDKQTTTLISSPESTDLYINLLSFFGNDLLERVFNTSGNIFFTENTVTRLYSKTVSASAGVVNYANSNNKTAIIEKNIVKDIGGVITNPTGYSAGATRAFTIQSPTLPTNKTYVLVQGNTFDNIFGREGDIIQCYDALSDSDAELSVSLVKINNNIFGGSNRRAIKIQGSNVEVTNNTFTTIDKTHPEWNRDGQGGAGIVSVGTFTNQYNNKGVIINGNTFNNNGGIKQSIYLQSHKDVSVTNNIHKGVSGFISLFGNTCKNITIKKNELYGLPAINLGTGAGVSYCDNIHYVSGVLKGLWENITELPSDFSFQRNEIYIDKANTPAFLALFVIDASVVSPTDCKGAIIKDNIVADAGNLTYGGLFRLPSKTFELKKLNVLSNHTHGTSPIYSSGNPIETKDSSIVNNTTSAGLYVKPTITP